jgi:hypothetical protein
MLLGDDKKENSLRIKMISFSFDCNKVIILQRSKDGTQA